MKKAFLFCLLFAGALPSCKKFVQQQELNAFMNLLTNGVWVVTNYTENGNNITSSFTGYSFQFHKDGTVAAINGSSSVNGTWAGNLSAQTITSNFPSAGPPLVKLNEVWKIKAGYADSVSAYTTINTQTNYLNIKKH